jgi:hypothetical protein
MSVPGRDEITHDVLSYLKSRSKAGDTLEGIVEWWLLEMKIRQSCADVKAILNDLVAQDLIGEYKGPDGRIHYRTKSSAAEQNHGSHSPEEQ